MYKRQRYLNWSPEVDSSKTREATLRWIEAFCSPSAATTLARASLAASASAAMALWSWTGTLTSWKIDHITEAQSSVLLNKRNLRFSLLSCRSYLHFFEQYFFLGAMSGLCQKPKLRVRNLMHSSYCMLGSRCEALRLLCRGHQVSLKLLKIKSSRLDLKFKWHGVDRSHYESEDRVGGKLELFERITKNYRFM